MSKKMKILHRTIFILCAAIFLASVICVLISFPSLPDDIGTHFDGQGHFDVFDKKYIGYPFLVTTGTFVINALAALIASKVKTGMKITSEGERKCKDAFQLLIDYNMLAFTVFFSGVWVYCVLTQQPLNTDIPVMILYSLFLVFILFIISVVVLRIRYSSKKSAGTKNNNESNEA